MGVETRRAAAGGRHKKATPPILSHDFVIQNHGDIMSCILMIFIVGLMFPATAPFCSVFIAPQYNETVKIESETGTSSVNVYRNGFTDLCTIFFYSVAWVVGHAVIQEYVLDKLLRKAHLSKSKTPKFAESGHMLVFSLYSVIHAGYVVLEFIQNHNDIKKIWLGYPEEHRWMTLNLKIFAILQIAYWLHQFPEFYFQKMKRDEIKYRTFTSVLFIFFIVSAYIMNFTRLAASLLLLEYISQTVFHLARLAHFLEKKSLSRPLFKIWNIVFILARLGSVILSVLTFWYGLRQSESAFVDMSAGNFNTSTVRLNCLLFLLALQLFQVWNFISFHVSKFKEGTSTKRVKTEKKPLVQPKKKVKTDESDSETQSDDVSVTAASSTKKGKKKTN